MVLNMTETQIMGLRVVSQDGHVLGDVSGLVVDTSSWRVAELAVRVRRSALEPLHLNKPMLGTQTIKVPASEIAGVSDAVVLRRTLGEFQFAAPEGEEQGGAPEDREEMPRSVSPGLEAPADGEHRRPPRPG